LLLSRAEVSVPLSLLLVLACNGDKSTTEADPPDDTATADTDTPDTPCAPTDWYADLDGDGFGIQPPVSACERPPDHVDRDGDCDDASAAAFPGAAPQDDPAGCLEDADADGYGAQVPTGTATPGTDCDDGQPTAFPGGTEQFGDAIDQDCDGADWDELFDDFELGMPDPTMFAANGGAEPEDNTVYAGLWSMALGEGTDLRTLPLDASACAALEVELTGTWLGSSPPMDTYVIEYWDGADWAPGGDWPRDFFSDWRTASATLPADASRADTSIRLRNGGFGSVWSVDDVGLRCVGPDADGDGVHSRWDCDDADPDHHADCGVCADADNDGFGAGCDLGGDCDDGDATVAPGRTDPAGDGADQDCSGVDGPGFADGFELGARDPLLWRDWSPEVTSAWQVASDGAWGLSLAGHGVATTQPVDTTACPGLELRWTARRGSNPTEGDWFDVEYWDGAAWIRWDALQGGAWDDDEDTVFTARGGPIADPAARHADFAVRWVASTNAEAADLFFIDDVALTCGPDADGDGALDGGDCAADDPRHWADCGACVDEDDDGYGAACDLGPDCTDVAADQHRGAADPTVDGIDQDCDEIDGPGLIDGFEADGPSPAVWATIDDVHPQTRYVAEGRTAAQTATGELVSVPLDTTACVHGVAWSWMGRGETLIDGLVMQYDDGAGWVDVDLIVAEAGVPFHYTRRAGVIDDPGAQHAQFRLRARGTSPYDWPTLDDVRVGCAAADADGDGVNGGLDCDDTDPAHWEDCGDCEDADEDGYGAGCDLGDDCNDGDPDIHPDAPDPQGDGVDQDCNGLDVVGLSDDFEDGAPDPAVWGALAGGWSYEDELVHAGDYSLLLEGGGTATTVPVDLSSCAEVFWSYVGRVGPDLPDGDLTVSWSANGGPWVLAHTQIGRDLEDVTFDLYQGAILAPGARSETFRLRLENTSDDWNGQYDDFVVDDLRLTCGPPPDADGDGVPDPADCAPADPDHQIDCGACVDADDDGYGAGCDLGSDCDDADDTVHPGQPDPVDGADANCDRIDGPALSDDFEVAEAPDPAVWDTLLATEIVVDPALEGDFALAVGWDDALAETMPFDTSACPVVAYDLRVLERAPLGEELLLSYSDGAGGWVPLERVTPDDQIYRATMRLQGRIDDPRAHRSDLRLRLEVTPRLANVVFDYMIDDIAFGCSAPDGDGDGWLPGADCDDADPDHWTDCGTCVDLDGDGFGVGCDRGSDCDDSQAAVSPAAVDPLGDGTDQDCSAHDGPGLIDMFEGGIELSPAVWAHREHAAHVTDRLASSGARALNLASLGAVETQPIDTASCASVSLRFDVNRRYGPYVDDDLLVSFHDGTGWVVADRVSGLEDPEVFVTRSMALPAAARHAALRVRLAVGEDSSSFVVDDFEVRCDAPDADGDGWIAADDCDDADPLHHADCGVCVDTDADGRGEGCDLGSDCDEQDATVHVGADDPAGDGVDADCSGVDGIGLSDGFEDDAWFSLYQSAALSTAQAHTGTSSLALRYWHTAVSHPFDATTCDTLSWSMWVKRGPDAPTADGRILLEWADGSDDWQQLQELRGNGSVGPWTLYQGAIADPAARTSDLRLRLSSDATSVGTFYVDDLAIACGDPDTDGDGWADAVDCDAASADHWAGCAQCVDGDNDGFGTGCDRGLDCDDSDATVSPEAADPPGDGVDGDCSGTDGPGLFDDFETSRIGPAWVAPEPGVAAAPVVGSAWSGSRSLELGWDAEIVSVPIDAAGCGELWWWFHTRGIDTYDDDQLTLSFHDGVGWVALEVVTGDNVGIWSRRSGQLPAAAARDGLQVRLSTRMDIGDGFRVDDLAVACDPPDDDFDAIPAGLDCDDIDPAHWFDCGVCSDPDSDGFGQRCDLGGDCGPQDPAISPWAPDESVDGVDQSCDQVDGVGLSDDFAMGIPDPGVWAWVDGDAGVQETGEACVGGGRACGPALVLGGGGGEAETWPLDTTACGSVAWALELRRGPEAPDPGDTLEVLWDDGTGWVPLALEEGDSLTGEFTTLSGTIVNPAALSTDLRLRLVSAGSAPGIDGFWVDDLRFGCAP
jgi:hypothetical protein